MDTFVQSDFFGFTTFFETYDRIVCWHTNESCDLGTRHFVPHTVAFFEFATIHENMQRLFVLFDSKMHTAFNMHFFVNRNLPRFAVTLKENDGILDRNSHESGDLRSAHLVMHTITLCELTVINENLQVLMLMFFDPKVHPHFDMKLFMDREVSRFTVLLDLDDHMIRTNINECRDLSPRHFSMHTIALLKSPMVYEDVQMRRFVVIFRHLFSPCIPVREAIHSV